MEQGRTSARRPKRPGVPARLEPLVRELAALPDEDRRAVLEAAEEAARSAPPAASWETLDSLRGVVSLGGNALEDCEKLYDD